MQQQVGGAAKGSVHHHGVFNGFVGYDILGGDAFLQQGHHCLGRLTAHFDPHGFARWGKGRVGQGQTKAFGHHLRGSGCAEKLAAATRRTAGATTKAGRVFKAQLVVGIARANGLHLAEVFTFGRRQGRAARHEHAGQIVHGCQSHHGCGQALVAAGNADNRVHRGQRTDLPAKDHGRIVAEGKGIVHARGSLGASVAGVGNIRGKGHALLLLDLLTGGRNLQSQFPVAHMQAKSVGGTIVIALAAKGADHKHVGAKNIFGLPAHARIQCHAKNIAAGQLTQHVTCKRQRTHRAGSVGFYLVHIVLRVGVNICNRHSILSLLRSCRFLRAARGKAARNKCTAQKPKQRRRDQRRLLHLEQFTRYMPRNRA